MRCTVIGAGNMGRKRIECLRALGVDDIAIYDAIVGKDADLAAVAYVAPTLADVWAWHPDALFVCTPPATHPGYLRRAHSVGVRALFCEKPLALQVPAEDYLAPLADAVTMVGCQWRWSDLAVQARTRISEYRPQFCRFVAAYHLPTVRPDYLSTYAAHVGVLEDVAWHLIDLAHAWFGPAEVLGAVRTPAESIGLPKIDGTAWISLRHRSGMLSQVYASLESPGYEVSWQFRKGWEPSNWLRWAYSQPPGEEPYQRETEHFLACARSGQQTVNPVSAAVEVGRILEEAKRRAR